MLFLPLPSPESTTQCPPCRGDVQDRDRPQDTCPCPFAVLGIGGRPQSSLDLGLFGCPALRGTKSHSPKQGRRHTKSDTYTQECAHTHSYTYSHRHTHYTCVYTQIHAHISMHIHTDTHMLTLTHNTYTHEHTGTQTYRYIHTLTHKHTQTCTQRQTYTHIHAQ